MIVPRSTFQGACALGVYPTTLVVFISNTHAIYHAIVMVCALLLTTDRAVVREQFTLEESAYVEIMGTKGTSEVEATAHFKRMRACLGE